MKPYGLLLSLSGLSTREAAVFHNVRQDTVKSWSAGRNNAPDGAIIEIKALIAAQEKAASEALVKISSLAKQRGVPDMIELGYPSDDYEATVLGFPTASAWGAMAARVVAGSAIPIRLVPRGSTTASAAASDAHQK